MTGPVRAGGAERVGALSSGAPRIGTRAGTAMTTLAGRVAGSIGRELRITRDAGRDGGREGGRGGGFAGNEDLYEVGETARALNGDLGGRAVDEGLLARSLGAFVTESASLLAARPHSPSLAVIQEAIARVEAGTRVPETVATALVDIDRTTAHVAGSVARAT